MRAVRRSLGWAWRWRLSFFMVESSPAMRERQRSALGSTKARWFTRMEEALDACDGRAMIFHNELLDAFPATLVEWEPAARLPPSDALPQQREDALSRVIRLSQ